jgi:hypothetical protein
MLMLAALMLGQTVSSPEEIEVRAARTRQALERCVEQRCSTPEDVDAAIAHAEAQFISGAYFDARKTLRAAIGRQKRNAAQYPRALAALYGANATVNIHIGDMKAFRTWSGERVRTLRAHLPASDTAVRAIPLQLGDAQLRLRNVRGARIQYDSAVRQYRRDGDERLAALAALRAAGIELQLRDFDRVRRHLAFAAESPAAGDATVRVVTAVVGARLALARGDETEVDLLLQTLRTAPGTPPVLLVDSDARSLLKGLSPDRAAGQDSPVQQILWSDIGFLVQPDGQVADVEVLRGSRSISWTKAIVEAVGKRQYVPIEVPVGSPGSYRVERVTWRAERATKLGSRIEGPNGPMGIEVLDLTQEPTPTPDPTERRIAKPA